MSNNNYDSLVIKIGLIAISIVALVLTYLGLRDGLVTSEQFMIIFGAVLGAWGISYVGNRVYEMGKVGGSNKSLEFAMQTVKELMPQLLQFLQKKEEKSEKTK